MGPDKIQSIWWLEKKITGLDIMPFVHNWPAIVSPFYDDVTQQSAYIDSQGTSEAAPMVTGGVALILQQFQDQFSVNLDVNPPLPSTIKAILIQTAEDLVHDTADPRDLNNPDTNWPVLYYEGPDFASGYGLVNIKAAVDLVADDPGPGAPLRLIHENELDGYQRHLYELSLTEQEIANLNGQLKFTLAWDDYPGDPTLSQTTPKLVNDLDLYLIGPDGTGHLPWTLDPLPVADCGGDGPGCGDLDPIHPSDVVPARKDVDRLNNVEMVQVDHLSPGRWLVAVSAYQMPMPLQPYALVGNHPAKFIQASDGGITSRVSLDSDNKEGNGQSDGPAISANGRFVAFSSWSSNLVSGDTNDASDIFVRDRQTGQTTRVSVNSAGSQANHGSYGPAISADGRYVVFVSEASNLVSGDSNKWSDIFLHDRDEDDDGLYDEPGAIKTRRVSLSSTGAQGNSSSFGAALSADARYVVFESVATNLVDGDTNKVLDVFLRDLQTGRTSRISENSAGEQANDVSYAPTISANGCFVAYESAADNLVSGDVNEAFDIFVHDCQTGQTTLVSLNSAGEQGTNSSSSPAISADGHFVAFWSYANDLVYADTNDSNDVFVHDRQNGKTTLISVNSAGIQQDEGTLYPYRPAISGDGRYVTFGSDATNLDVLDTNNLTDIFLHDRQTGETSRVSVSSSHNQGNQWAWDSTITADGRVVAFSSEADNLVAGDTNDSGDVYVHQRFTTAPDYRSYLPISASR